MQQTAQATCSGAPGIAAPAARCAARRAPLPLPLAPLRLARRCARHTAVTVAAKKGVAEASAPAKKVISEADLYIAADAGAPPPAAAVAPPQRALPPWYLLAPAALAGAVLVLRTIKAIRRRFRGEDRLAERGYKRNGYADDSYYTKLMKNMKTVQYEELSDEQIAAARRRRQREVSRDRAPMDLDAIELPENHPFAVKKEVSAEEEARMKSRLSARRGLSAEDMALLRQQQALADEMDSAQA